MDDSKKNFIYIVNGEFDRKGICHCGSYLGEKNIIPDYCEHYEGKNDIQLVWCEGCNNNYFLDVNVEEEFWGEDCGLVREYELFRDMLDHKGNKAFKDSERVGMVKLCWIKRIVDYYAQNFIAENPLNRNQILVLAKLGLFTNSNVLENSLKKEDPILIELLRKERIKTLKYIMELWDVKLLVGEGCEPHDHMEGLPYLEYDECMRGKKEYELRKKRMNLSVKCNSYFYNEPKIDYPSDWDVISGGYCEILHQGKSKIIHYWAD